MTRFHHQRVPLVILFCGTACVGKSTIATQLAQRLNLPNVLQTDMVYKLLRTSTDAPLASTPVWTRDFNSSEELITEFCRECRVVRKGLAVHLKKAMKDRNPIIIETMRNHLLLYKLKIKGMNSTSAAPDDSATVQTENSNEGSHDENHGGSRTLSSNEGISMDQVDAVSNNVASINLAGSTSGHEGPKPIIAPIVLKMAEFDHKICSRTFTEKCPDKDKDKLIENLKTIRDYLCSFTSQGLTVVNVSATTFPKTLDWLHNHLLQYSAPGAPQLARKVRDLLQKSGFSAVEEDRRTGLDHGAWVPLMLFLPSEIRFRCC
ncbi:hypothetical protein Ahy_A07g035048 [Arachis hypogaea]|uniref:Extradiol ring-cleavage dioxygenase class III enzyme subunit B domain-containing protein n=1 Tax=Arachis hypogaea TaxID=3818 RepID=A0A445CDK4_ARAHY|nr:hypothetical protein Ahy_A07g035048 [Arachis hypogaea]